MYINNWDISFDSNYAGKVIGVTKKLGNYRILIRNGAIHITEKRNDIFKIPSNINNLPQLFAEHLSNNKESRKKIERELTILKKIGILINIDVT
jgi:hypothetical protein